MTLQSARQLLASGASAAFTVARWSVGLALLGLALSLLGVLLLWDEGWAGLRAGGWLMAAAIGGALLLLLAPLGWWWLGQTQGVSKALLRLVGPRTEALLEVLFLAIEERHPGRPLDAPTLIAVLRQPGLLGGLAGLIVRVLRWRLDLDRTVEHLEAAVAAPAAANQPPQRVLSAALAADLGERWLPDYGWLVWVLALFEAGLILGFGWG